MLLTDVASLQKESTEMPHFLVLGGSVKGQYSIGTGEADLRSPLKHVDLIYPHAYGTCTERK